MDECCGEMDTCLNTRDNYSSVHGQHVTKLNLHKKHIA